MKSVFVALAGLAALAAAQDLGDLPKCAQTCAANMVSAEKSKELGCETGDLSCLCVNQNFVYGIRDCSGAICDKDGAAKAVQYGLAICKSAGVKITTSGSDDSSAGSTKTESADSTASGESSESGESGKSASLTTIYSIIGTESGSAIATPIATSTIGGDDEDSSATVSTFTETSVTTGKTTLGKASGTPSAVVTTYTTGGTEVVETLTTVTGSASGSGSESGDESSATGTGSESGSGSEESGAATSTDNAGMPQMTAAPAGFLAAAGLAVFLL